MNKVITPNINTLVILCNNTREAELVNFILPRSHNITRMFIILESEEDKNSKNFASEQDLCLVIPDTEDNQKNQELAVRAGLLYGIGWNFVFCKAKTPPTYQEIEESFQALMNDKDTYATDNTWSITKEHVLINGFSYDGKQDVSEKSPQENEDDTDMFGFALVMSGQPGKEKTVARAIAEVCPNTALMLHPQFSSPSEPNIAMLKIILNNAVSTDNEMPQVILLGEKTSEDLIKQQFKRLPANGVVVVASSNEDLLNGKIKAYRKFTVSEDTKQYNVLLFSKQ